MSTWERANGERGRRTHTTYYTNNQENASENNEIPFYCLFHWKQNEKFDLTNYWL